MPPSSSNPVCRLPETVPSIFHSGADWIGPTGTVALIAAGPRVFDSFEYPGARLCFFGRLGSICRIEYCSLAAGLPSRKDPHNPP